MALAELRQGQEAERQTPGVAAADVVFFQEHRWTAPRPSEQRSRNRKKRWDVTLSPALQSERSENASCGGTGIACRAGINATDVRSLGSRITRACCCAEQRHADVPGFCRQRQGHRFLRGIGGAAPLCQNWQLTWCYRWRE